MAIQISSDYILSKEELLNHFKVSAGPGAGKTHFLVNNIKNIINTNPKIKNSKNKKILCITYTNAAVDIIKSRLDEYSQNVVVSTIHSFIIEYLIKPYQDILKKIIQSDFDIEITSKNRITSQVEGLGVLHGFEKEHIYEYINNYLNKTTELSFGKKSMGDVQIDLNKFIEDLAKGLKLENLVKELKSPKTIPLEYIKPIKIFTWNEANKLTHDEILYFGYRILTSNDLISYIIRVQFPFIFVDEFQDTNPIQSKLIQHIGNKGTIIGIIGDIAQSIYSFQGATPSYFYNFNINSKITPYEIQNNRRSTQNIVSLCNYIRKAENFKQISTSNASIEKVTFLSGNADESTKKIQEIISSGGVVITRTWAAAFNYIEGVSSNQKDLLRKTYNSYYNTAVDIRADISEHNNVTWVRAFKFIILLYSAFRNKSVISILSASSLYINNKEAKKSSKITPELIISFNEMLKCLYNNLDTKEKTVDIINRFNNLLNKSEYIKIKEYLFQYTKKEVYKDDDFISCFTEYDNDKLIQNVSSLEWDTSVKLFNEVFSEESKYMTVHQAKGREWDTVVACIEPSKFDYINFATMFVDPQIIAETTQDEFTRMFYVACSRARKKLYIHLVNTHDEIQSFEEALSSYVKENNIEKFYEFKGLI